MSPRKQGGKRVNGKAFHLHKRRADFPDIQASYFVQDPYVARRRGGRVGVAAVALPGEPYLGAGPTTSRVAVVDYNADLDETFAPVRVRKDGRGFTVGARKPEDNFFFHQVNAWALVTRTLNLLEGPRLFGRSIPWAFEGSRLVLIPHAGYWENAFYDRETGALHFFYFEGSHGERVYTCLSHDIVTHELGHAVLDGLKPLYNEVGGPDAAGFHEYFGDALAMTSALTQREVVIDAVGKPQGTQLPSRNLVAKIADGFGAALDDGGDGYGEAARDYLRRADHTLNMADVAENYEEHDRSQVLTGAFYDVLRYLYGRHVRRRAKQAGKLDGGVTVGALITAARRTSQIMFRGLDYCPPVDVSYTDYALAVLRADEVTYPRDDMGFRAAIRKILVRRGLLSEADLRGAARIRVQNGDLRKYDIERLAATPTDAYAFVDASREAFGIPRAVDFQVVRLTRTNKESLEHYPPREIIIEFAWQQDLPLRGREYGPLRGTTHALWCGGTVVFDTNGNILHYASKPATAARRRLCRAYLQYLVKQGYVGIVDEAGLGARGTGDHRVQARVARGALRTRRVAALRHASGGRRG